MSYPYEPRNDVGKGQLMFCPFNPTHQMAESSFQRHVIRCRKNHPSYVSCPYNAMHFFPTREILTGHVANCPCKPSHSDEKVKENQELVHMSNLKDVRLWNMSDENWDDEL